MTAVPRPATILVLLGGLVVAASLATSQPTTQRAPATPTELVRATGRISVANTHNGRALLVARRLAPGRRATGSITLRNPGTRAAAITLRQSVATTKRGRGGARLTDTLRLSVREGGPGGSLVYDGPIAELRSRVLRPLGPKRSRRYSFAVSLSRKVSNAYQAASLTVTYRWTARAAPPPPPGPPPGGQPPPPSGGTSAPPSKSTRTNLGR